jgi:hypothetical protein
MFSQYFPESAVEPHSQGVGFFGYVIIAYEVRGNDTESTLQYGLYLSVLLVYSGKLIMPIVFERSVFKTGSSLRINIPLEVCKALSINEGDTLAISVNDHQAIMEKVRKK